MAVRGRKPKPTALKLLQGTRSDQVNYHEPRLPIGSTAAPAALSGIALDLWNELAPMLANAGMFTEGDRVGLLHLCRDHEEAMTTNDSKAKDRLRRLLTEFGLTPSSRSRLKSTIEPPKDKLAQHLDKLKKKA
jgi:phage terminase small subunit